MKVSLAKALKVKNQVGGRLAKLQGEIRQWNRVTSDNVGRYDVRTKYDELFTLYNDLTDLKHTISVANQPIQRDIIELAERKGLLTVLQGIPGDDWIETGYEGVKTQYVATVKRPELEAEQEKVKGRITELQDKLDAYNATTLVDVKDYLTTL